MHQMTMKVGPYCSCVYLISSISVFTCSSSSLYSPPNNAGFEAGIGSRQSYESKIKLEIAFTVQGEVQLRLRNLTVKSDFSVLDLTNHRPSIQIFN
jgi:hypothetical protein